MRSEYDFGRGQRGKFHRPGARLRVPVYLDAPARKHVEVTVGESVRIIRELQGLSQNQLAAAAGIPRTRISNVERGRVNLGVERAKALARALHEAIQNIEDAIRMYLAATDEQLRSPTPTRRAP
jgi:DNA-binding XRE family transcriptional regulator